MAFVGAINTETNIECLDLIIRNLNKIKRAMIEAWGFQEVLAMRHIRSYSDVFPNRPLVIFRDMAIRIV